MNRINRLINLIIPSMSHYENQLSISIPLDIINFQKDVCDSISDLFQNASLNNKYLNLSEAFKYIFDWYNPTQMIYDMYYKQSDPYTHYTPRRYMVNLLPPNTPELTYQACYLSIQNKIINEWRENNQEDLYDICCINLLHRDKLKENVLEFVSSK